MALTYIAIVFLVLLAVLVRILVPRWSSLRRRQLLLLLALIISPSLLSALTGWDSTSLRLDAALFWTRLLVYELCVLAFTVLRPRSLTVAIAVVLTLPLFSSVVAGPASGLFTSAQTVLRPVGGGYFLELLPWTSGPNGNSGADFTFFYKPPGVHLIRRSFVGARIYNSQCNTLESTGSIDPAKAHITLHCPALSTDPAAPPSGTELDFLIPRGALSPALAHNLRQ